MAVRSNFSYKGSTYSDVTFKIVRVFGSKKEGWNAVIAFVVTGDEFVEDNFKGLIPVGVQWDIEAPYPALYRALENILNKGGFDIKNETTEVVETQIEQPTPKIKKTKKVKLDGKLNSSS